jgi:endoglucanase Acf2
MIPLQIKFMGKTKAVLLVLFLFLFSVSLSAQQDVSVGLGSYSTTLPSGAVGPQNSDGQNILPKIPEGFDQPIQTNDFWSSLIFPFFGDPHSATLYAHPLLVNAGGDGLEIGYRTEPVFAAQDYLFPFSSQLKVGVEGLNASKTVPSRYSDWTVTALWDDGNQQMEATLGHGLPFVYFEIEGGELTISPVSTPNIWYNAQGVLGITVNGKHYGIFAPTGSTWNTNGNLRSALSGKGFLSVALLPDNQPSTLEYYRKRAYAFVTNTTVEWEYDEDESTLLTTYAYETELKDSAEGNLNETLSALYRHQWKYANEIATDYSYGSPRGEMRVFEGNTFSTTLTYQGILPALPNQGDYNPEVLLDRVKDVANETLTAGPSYQNGKAMARFANLVHIADQLGAVNERDYFLAQLKTRLEDWFTAGGEQEYSYNEDWDVLTGYPSGFGADREINDHHFHSSYAIVSAATVAQYDPEWASNEKWGGMVNLLIKDSNNWNREDGQFPFLRSHDIYAGHSWAAGHAAFGDGNNQESSSESMNFASAVILWGEVSGQDEIRDLGIYLYTTETTAIEQYWFDIEDEVFPDNYPYVAIGMVWGGKGVHSTWFGADPEFIHGINLLPVTSGSLYLGRHPEYVKSNYNEVVEERNGQPEIWKDVFWQYLALADPDQALSYYLSDPNYEAFDGESKAHTMHWLYNLKKMGQVDISVTANIPTYAVFNDGSDKTYVAYNAGSTQRSVLFSDGYSMEVPAGKMKTETTAEQDPEKPVVILTADKKSGKSPLTVDFTGGNSFDRNDSDLSYNWNFANIGSSTAADTSFTFLEEGSYTVYLTVTNEQGLTDSDSITIEVLPNGTPFGGAPATVPGLIEAENYDLGGEGIAYHDVDENNIGLAYRPDEGVDIENSSGGGYDVYWIVAGEWLEYTFEVEQSGIYTFSPSVSTVPGFGYFYMLIDNEDVSGRRNVTHTGGWQSWTSIPIEGVELEEGIHRMRFEFNSDSDKEGWLMSLDNIQVSLEQATNGERESILPNEFMLSQNYPNPFNPTTQISYSLPRSTKVTLRVMNVLGQTVRNLVDGAQQSGTHTVTFDAAEMPSGVYFYRLEAGSFTQSRKMLLVK